MAVEYEPTMVGNLEYEIHKLSRVPIYSVFYLEICTPN